ncbi:PAS domain S-box protein [Methylomonas rhizoryzae]|uniref:PAS domain S-box protein n=1 Tax=Methylomonas rhizoryzae TaxID=2608981 RepID=UPI001231D4DD|nr:PAS domain S-box protein [Methylomonas rhizoryzae]
MAAGNNSTQAQTGDTASAPDYLVAIGASAGGLEALRELVESLPDSKSLCYIIAQHVSPNHSSILPHLLSPLTTLEVRELNDKQRPEPGCIFITPSNKDVAFSAGLLHITEPERASGPKPSINHLFHSLADGAGQRTVGIVLSGTGTDGASGLRAIKTAGGVTMVQEPDSAKYDAMPKAAIHTGSIDLVLRPAQMGTALQRLIANPQGLNQIFGNDDEADEFQQIGTLVRVNTAFRLSDYKIGTIKRRIARRMGILGIATLVEYLEYLKSHKTEAHALVRDTFIGVTAFFRDSETFPVLGRAIAEIVRNQAEQGVIRCWVPGCATGEEAYSIAMLFEEALLEQNRNDLQYVIFASDLDDEALEHARTASYPASSLDNVPETLRLRYTETVNGYCRILKNIRNRLVFARQNLIEDPPFARLDLISCRNLLIYLNPPVQKRIFEIFHYSLNRGGYLFLGKSESPESYKHLFEDVDNRARLYLRQDSVARYSLPLSQGLNNARNNPRNATRNPAVGADSINIRTLECLAEHYAPPSLLINESDNIVYFHGNLKPFLCFPKGPADMHLFDLLDKSVRAELRALVYRCRRELRPISGGSWHFTVAGQAHTVTPIVSPLEPEQGRYLLISFKAVPVEAEQSPEVDPGDRDHNIISELEQELSNTRAHLNIIAEELETANEELQSLNEELQSANEEMQSTNEELQTSNEELQSANEELLMVNEEMLIKSAELEAVVNDLTNVKQSLAFPLIVVDKQLRITQANSACRHIAAFDTPLERSSLTTVQWQLEVPGLVEQVRRVVSDAQSYEATLKGTGAAMFRLFVMPYRKPAGDVDGAVLVFQDITRQHHTEEALRVSNERFELAVRGSNDGLWDWDIANNRIYFSPRYAEILGYTDREWEPSLAVWESHLHPDDCQATLAALEAHLKQSLPYHREYRLRHKSGHYIWVLARGQAIRDDAGAPIRMSGSISDISLRKRVELALREIDARNRALIENAPDAVIVIDELGSIELCNPACETIFGYAPDELINRNISILMGGEDGKMHNEYLAHYLRTGKSRVMGMGRDVTAYCKDGKGKDVHISLGEFRLENGQHRFVGFIRDLSERVRAEKALRESEEKFHLAMHFAPTGKALIAEDGRFLEVNPALCTILGYDSEALLRRDEQSVTHPDDLADGQHHLQRLQRGEIPTFQIEKRYLRKDGGVVWAQLNVAQVADPLGTPLYNIAQIQDITQRKQADDELRLAASVFSNTQDGIVIASSDFTILKVNQAFERLLGYAEREALGKPIGFAATEQYLQDYYRPVIKAVRKTGSWQGEVWCKHRQGRDLPVWLSIAGVRNQAGDIDRYTAVVYDISDQKMSQERINYLAHYDAMTDLPNRTLFMDRLEHALNQARRQARSLALMFIDLDNFKQVNDTYGHSAGNELLRQVAERLKRTVRESDTLARLSGDEFMLMVEDAERWSGLDVTGRKILTALAQPVELAEGRVFISASIGIAVFPNDGDDIDTLVKHADLAMYRSKEAGRNQLHFFTQDLSLKVQERMMLHNDLRHALEHEQFELHYQPVIDVTSRRCVGAEALIRWQHPSKGWIPPSKFITVAEENSLIHSLGQWVLLTACRQMKTWLDAGIHLDFLSVNVSGKQIAQGDFVGIASQVLRDTQCPADRIVLELTESYIMRESEGAIELLTQLRDFGFGIAIDDFGTGYSSLSYLKRLPVTKLKLDQSFVNDIPSDGNDAAIARAILKLGETLGLQVVAEGVESEAQHHFLFEEACLLGQGFWYARPMPAKDFSDFWDAIEPPGLNG